MTEATHSLCAFETYFAAAREELKDEPSFAQLFVTHPVRRTSRVEEDLIDQLFNSSASLIFLKSIELISFCDWSKLTNGTSSKVTFSFCRRRSLAVIGDREFCAPV
jgi:hypothetical protein